MRRSQIEKLSEHVLADGYPIVMDLEQSKGSYIKDVNGDEYLDMFSMFASGSVGYNHPYIVEKEQILGKLAVNKPTMSDIYNDYYVDFVETFARVFQPDGMDYMFFVSGGALAVENALKVAFDWKTRLNHMQGIKKEASQVIHFKQAFHGRSGYTMSLTNTKDPRKYMYFPKFDWPRVTNPKLKFPLTDDHINQTISLEKIAIDEIETSLEENKNEIACIIIETIQGEGGDNFFRKEFLKKLRKICDENEILLIFDEVQCGVCITGENWAFQHYDVQPDVLSFGKKTQVCGIMANKEKLDQVPGNVFQESSRINSTFGGNFIDMMRFKYICEIIEQEKLKENAKEVGTHLLEELKKIEANHSMVSNARGLGLWCAIDLTSDEERHQVIKECFNLKLIVLPCGEKSIRFRPHLTVTKEEVDQAIKTLDLALEMFN